jgi:hypothetical protein
MLKDKRVGIETYMIHERIDLMHHSYNDDADIIVLAYTKWNNLFHKSDQETGTGVHIEFITNKTSGVKRTETYKWWSGRYLGCKREYIKKRNI